MQVGCFVFKEDWDPIAAVALGFRMQRLVNVADEVKKEFERFIVRVLVEVRVEDAGSLF